MKQTVEEAAKECRRTTAQLHMMKLQKLHL